jgi:hypothetical protein
MRRNRHILKPNPAAGVSTSARDFRAAGAARGPIKKEVIMTVLRMTGGAVALAAAMAVAGSAGAAPAVNLGAGKTAAAPAQSQATRSGITEVRWHHWRHRRYWHRGWGWRHRYYYRPYYGYYYPRYYYPRYAYYPGYYYPYGYSPSIGFGITFR